MAYANVKCEECGLIMPQNEAIPVEVSDAAVVASNDLSFGLSGERLRLWQQGDRTYTHNKRIFYCSSCYASHSEALESAPSQERPTKLQIFLKMLLLNFLYKIVRGGLDGIFKPLPGFKPTKYKSPPLPKTMVNNQKINSHYGNRNKSNYKRFR